MSRLYNYFVTCWKYNSNFTEINLDNAVDKGLITADEKAQILLIPREI
ncbi:hypothetical protein [Clostridium sp. OS1-26]|nr:hypothetical protein [Clostridium sp. OS1-26]WML35937.1 hypothetical protein RCG18_04100 [Clostridium sp. OS1-26]